MLLSTHNLTKDFGAITAVEGVDFTLERGELCSVIGPNGAGKTTFFNLLTGVLEPTAGRIEFAPTSRLEVAARDAFAADDDLAARFESPDALVEAIERDEASADRLAEWLEPADITDAPAHETALLGLHRSYQITNIFPTVSVLENVRIAVQAHRGGDSWRFWRNVNAFDDHVAEAESILSRIGLAADASEPAETLSHGEKRKLEIGVALAGDPDLLLLDEPTAGVSSEDVGTVTGIIEDVADDHAVMLIEHNMDVVMDISDRVAVLNQGELIEQGEPEAVRSSDAVQRAYLGGYDGSSGAADSEPDESGDTGVSAG